MKILALSISLSLPLSAGRTSVPACEGEMEAGESAAGCCAFSGEATAKIGKTRATHVRSFTFMANPPDDALVRWVLCSLVWLVGVLLASPKDTKNAPEKTFFVLLFGLRLPFRRFSAGTRGGRILCIRACRRWWRSVRLLTAENPRQPGGRRRVTGHVPTVQVAEFGRLRAVNVDFLTRDGTLRRGQLQRIRIDGDSHNAFRHQEKLDVTVGGQSDRASHEIRPDGRGSTNPG